MQSMASAVYADRPGPQREGAGGWQKQGSRAMHTATSARFLVQELLVVSRRVHSRESCGYACFARRGRLCLILGAARRVLLGEGLLFFARGRSALHSALLSLGSSPKSSPDRPQIVLKSSQNRPPKPRDETPLPWRRGCYPGHPGHPDPGMKRPCPGGVAVIPGTNPAPG